MDKQVKSENFKGRKKLNYFLPTIFKIDTSFYSGLGELSNEIDVFKFDERDYYCMQLSLIRKHIEGELSVERFDGKSIFFFIRSSVIYILSACLRKDCALD